MGDIVQFKRPAPPVSNIDPEYDGFVSNYQTHIGPVNEFLQRVVAAAAETLDIGAPHKYDMFMMRETLMSMLMRDKGQYHPLQDFTEEFVQTFGN